MALLGSEEAVLDYLGTGETVPSRADRLSAQAATAAPVIATSLDEPFRLVSEEASPKRQRRLGFGEPTLTSSTRPDPPRCLECPDPRTARYLAIVVRIIDAHRRFPGRTLLGRKKVEKIVHVIERHLGLDLGREPIRAAAGPLDMSRHKSVCRIAEERGIFQTIEPERHASEDAEGDSPREAIRFEPLDHFDQALAESVEDLGIRVAEVDDRSPSDEAHTLQAETVATLMPPGMI